MNPDAAFIGFAEHRSPSREDFDPFAALDDLRAEAGLTACLWGGAPPCPKCGTDHGFKADKVETEPWRVARERIEISARA